MTMNYITQDGTMFGTTRFFAIGKRKPKLIYGEQAKKLREDAGISVEDLSKELSIKKDLIEGIEATKKSMDEKVMQRYCDKFGVTKEFFFDLDLEVFICNDNGNVLKEYATSEECKKQFDFIKEQFVAGCDDGIKNFSMFIDFSKEAK